MEWRVIAKEYKGTPWGHENVLYLGSGGSYTDVLVFWGCHKSGGLNTEIDSLTIPTEVQDGGMR